jgi:endonuclease/exonuclease/phosphatase family metal-dependent hydrolase
MTRNLYLGADLDPVVAAASTGDPLALIQAVSATWANVVATDFPERVDALADEIEESKPLLVGLQEVSLYRTGPPDSFSSVPMPATHEEYDFLKILLQELNNEQGLHYAPVVVTQNYDVEFPGFTSPGVLRDIRLTDRDVILARTDLPVSELKLSNAQTANLATNVSLPIGGTGQSVTISRGWGSVDAKVRGKTFRFINTHLEPESPSAAVNAIQVAQGNEILSGPADTELPVILAGDYNSRADGTGTQTYDNLIGAEFTDAWSTTHPGELGNTWGHDDDLRNMTVDLTQRLDLVLFRGGLCAFDADLVGEKLTDRTPSGLWPSDHAGIVATLGLQPAAHVPKDLEGE